MIHEMIAKRRTIRRFKPRKIPKEILVKCVDAARLSPSGRNLQPLKYIVVNDEATLDKVFPTLKWAALIPGFFIAEDERPQAYILILHDPSIRPEACHDVGIAAMSISMVALEHGLGSCIMANIDREKLRQILNVPEGIGIELLVALGYPAHKAFVERMKGDDTRYWTDERGDFHVPKRELEEILSWNSYNRK